MNFIFKHFFHVPYISLVNLIAGDEVVQELFGANFTGYKIKEELSRLVKDDSYRTKMLEAYGRIRTVLGDSGASGRASQLIIKYMQTNKVRF